MKGNSISVRFTALMVVTMVLTACATSNSKGSDCAPVAINVPDNAWHYQGPGAAASFMLMSSSGPMGAAIGVAIDQGIQKDLLEGMDDPVQIVYSATQEELRGIGTFLLSEETEEEGAVTQSQQWRIEWNQFGFRSDMSSERITNPVMRATVYKNGDEVEIYSLSDEAAETFAYPLNELIENSELSNQVLFEAANEVVKSAKAGALKASCSG